MFVTVVDRPVRFIVKRFVFRIPVLGLGMRFAGYVPLDKEGVGEDRKRIAPASRLIQEKGFSFLVYPEGTRSWEGSCCPSGGAASSWPSTPGAPIVPVSVKGTYELMPRGRRTIRKGTVRIVFHEPIAVAGIRRRGDARAHGAGPGRLSLRRSPDQAVDRFGDQSIEFRGPLEHGDSGPCAS
ncbi:MAG: 1-acyl-sn-glycerol-3-phosphate acyltransferase [Candidatus Moduliflexus flocculans]|nr:1-acyl-sn-glycerol-3-phosphate acyltransferase [Candidatus Moduliflexus flocculans]